MEGNERERETESDRERQRDDDDDDGDDDDDDQDWPTSRIVTDNKTDRERWEVNSVGLKYLLRNLLDGTTCINQIPERRERQSELMGNGESKNIG